MLALGYANHPRRDGWVGGKAKNTISLACSLLDLRLLLTSLSCRDLLVSISSQLSDFLRFLRFSNLLNLLWLCSSLTEVASCSAAGRQEGSSCPSLHLCYLQLVSLGRSRRRSRRRARALIASRVWLLDFQSANRILWLCSPIVSSPDFPNRGTA